MHGIHANFIKYVFDIKRLVNDSLVQAVQAIQAILAHIRIYMENVVSETVEHIFVVEHDWLWFPTQKWLHEKFKQRKNNNSKINKESKIQYHRIKKYEAFRTKLEIFSGSYLNPKYQIDGTINNQIVIILHKWEKKN